MTRVVLIRPGATDFDDQDRIQGVLDLPLSKHGSDEVARAVSELQSSGISAIYAGSGEATLQTAKAISDGLGIKLRQLDRLHNLHHGLWQALQVDEVRRKHPRVYKQWCESPTKVCPPGGESITEAFERVSKALKSVVKRHTNATIAIVAPCPLIWVIRCYLLKLDLDKTFEGRDRDGMWENVELSGAEVESKR